MDATGIICEYNPLHLGHKKQFDIIKTNFPHSGIVCLMSGNYVQRGAPAIIDKSIRAKAAILSGADLVLELPINASLSSAEGFAEEGVRILSGFCNRLCFGTESGTKESLLAAAEALLSPAFPEALRTELSRGLSFPAARQAALQAMHISEDTLTLPNDILATEYCKAILRQNLSMEPMPILREGNYHADSPDPENPSATALRKLLLSGNSWQQFVPANVSSLFQNATLHTLSAGETAILYRLRTMEDREFEALPYGSEGLWRKLMHNARKFATLEEIITATKSKRYTRTRLDRMVMCAFLVLTQKDLSTPAPYTRVLAFNEKGREILKTARQTGLFPNAGAQLEHPWQTTENRTGDLYGLFAVDHPEPPMLEKSRRIFCLK